MRLVTLVTFLLLLNTPSHAITCMNAQGPGHPWAWRLIDGKKCWYKGKAGMDKTKLRWAKGKPAKALLTRPTNNDELLHTIWPKHHAK